MCRRWVERTRGGGGVGVGGLVCRRWGGGGVGVEVG